MNSQLLNFWKKKTDCLTWHNKPQKIYLKKKNFYFKWFEDGSLNVFTNCITKNIESGLGNKIAIITIDDYQNIKYYSFNDIDNYVDNFCLFLKTKLKGNLEKKKVMIHSSACLNSAISMLACAKLGIEFSVIFENLEFSAIKNRVYLFKPNLFLTNIKKKNNNQKFKNLKNVIFFSDIKYKFENKIKLLAKSFKSNKKLFTLFTSGSTGIPKGIIHGTGGYLLYTKLTCMDKFGITKNSVVLTASDAGWINGHTYSLFGPLSLGATTILLNKPTIILDYKFLKKILIKLKVTTLYLPVTLIRLMKSIFPNKKIKASSLKVLGSMGEPLANIIGKWFSNFFFLNNKAIINTYFQTETGGIISSPNFKDYSKIVPHGSVGKPLYNQINLSKLNKTTKKEIRVKNPWPGCMIDVLNGLKVWKKYWAKNREFRLFDLATKETGNIYIHGRIDDVINIRGHRIGSGEIESVLLKIKAVRECCAVVIPDKLEGNVIYLFISSANTKIDDNINKIILEYFGTYALPKKIIYLNELPKTRSGKIMRRLLRDITVKKSKNKIGDTTTILNPNVIDDIYNKLND